MKPLVHRTGKNRRIDEQTPYKNDKMNRRRIIMPWVLGSGESTLRLSAGAPRSNGTPDSQYSRLLPVVPRFTLHFTGGNFFGHERPRQLVWTETTAPSLRRFGPPLNLAAVRLSSRPGNRAKTVAFDICRPSFQPRVLLARL